VGTIGDPGVYVNLDLSEDDRYVAVSQFKEPHSVSNADIWTLDVLRAGTASLFTNDPGYEWDPAWSTKGTQVAFTCLGDRRQARQSLCIRPLLGGDAQDQVVVTAARAITAPDWSSDDRFIVYTQVITDDNYDLRTVSLETRVSTPFADTKSREASGTFSPNDRWIAYESDESGRREVYVAPFPRGARGVPISRNGGRSPRWRGDGRELFFLALDGVLMSATLERTTGMWSVPTRLFPTGLINRETFHPYDVDREGRRVLAPVQVEFRDPPAITLVQNWPAMFPR
jgi:Tol biopolymer transport system component